MEHRKDLEQLLLNGLPEADRGQAIEVMDKWTALQIQDKRAPGPRVGSAPDPRGTPAAG